MLLKRCVSVSFGVKVHGHVCIVVAIEKASDLHSLLMRPSVIG